LKKNASKAFFRSFEAILFRISPGINGWLNAGEWPSQPVLSGHPFVYLPLWEAYPHSIRPTADPLSDNLSGCKDGENGAPVPGKKDHQKRFS
jgi:hypothetical protein